MKNRKIIIGLLLVALAAIIGGGWYSMANKKSASSAETTKAEVTKVKIAYLPIVQGLPLYLAVESGYFKEAGLDVEIVKFDAPNQIIDALISGQVDFASPGAATGITGIAETKNPGHLRIFALTGGDDKVSNDSILVKKDSTIKSISELKGKKLGILSGIQWRTIARQILAQNNLAADQDVILVELAPGLQAQALGSGQIDALLGVEPVPTIIKANNISKEIVAVPTAQYVANPFYGGAGVVGSLFAEQNPKTTAKVLEVFDRAIQRINQNPDETRPYLKNYTPLTDSQITQVPISLFKMYKNFTQNDVNATQKLFDIFPKFGVIDKQIDFQKLIYSPTAN